MVQSYKRWELAESKTRSFATFVIRNNGGGSVFIFHMLSSPSNALPCASAVLYLEIMAFLSRLLCILDPTEPA